MGGRASAQLKDAQLGGRAAGGLAYGRAGVRAVVPADVRAYVRVYRQTSGLAEIPPETTAMATADG